ncbi:MAG: hypothetical protein HDR83_01530 [Bacteroides sp.]|nr:hypothetical protein [Bacteroides sp.]
MDKNSYGFCNNEVISTKITHLIANSLLSEQQLRKIIGRYSDMRENFNKYPADFAKDESEQWKFSKGLEPFAPEGRGCYSDTTAVPISISHPDFVDLTTRSEKRGAIGLDFPTWFYKSPGAPFIMIVAQDPLRSAKWYGECNDAVVSSPFGLQDAHHRENGNGGKRMWLLVQKLLERGYNVYLTDCRKFFVYNHAESDKYTTSGKMEIYRNVLMEEIEIINPELIVTLGHRADNTCRSLLGDDYRLSGYIPHLCGTATHKIYDYFKIIKDTNIHELAVLYTDLIESIIHNNHGKK